MKAWDGLVQQHAEAIHDRVAACLGRRQQSGFQWTVDNVVDQGPGRQPLKRDFQRRLADHAEAGGIDQQVCLG